MLEIRFYRVRWFVRALGAAAMTMTFAAGCTPVVNPSGGGATGPATTSAKVAPAGSGVAMLDLTGEWFFILRTPDGEAVFTQRGDFELRADGKIVYDDGWYIQGFKAEDDGALRTDKLRDLKIVIGQASPVHATTRVQIKGNVNPEDAEVGDETDTTFTVYDAAGEAATIYVAAVMAATDATGTQLQFDVRLDSASGSLLARATFRFDADGAIEGESVLQVSSGTPTLSFDVEVDAVETSSRKDSSIALASQDGVGNGTLTSYAIGNDGAIVGEYSNGLDLLLGQYVIASFASPSDLAAVSGRNDLFTETTASGTPHPAVSVAE